VSGRRRPGAFSSEALGGAAAPGTVRCAIYTRKSVEKGLDQEFNSLDLQRESCEAYIASQKHAGWTALPDSYDDGGYSGGNMDRPAMARLMADIEAGKIDSVVTYKVDRMSRSLLDFAQMMEVFERKSVSFVSVTQHFNTATSLGRLILHILLSFAQFERETIIERVRDKMSAARKKGKWVGGAPILGYDVAPEGRRLIVNEVEAERVREIFRIYLEKKSLLETIRELERRGWKTKHRISRRSQRPFGGRPFDKPTLYQLLTNATYAGIVEYDGGSYAGEHPAIVPKVEFEDVQETLKRNGRGGRSEGKIKHHTLLRGLLFCKSCQAPMIHHFTSKKGRRFCYYHCSRAAKKGWNTCPSKLLPMEPMDRFIVEQLRAVSRDKGLAAEVTRQVRSQNEEQALELQKEWKALAAELKSTTARVGELAAQIDPTEAGNREPGTPLTDLEGRLRQIERRRSEIREALAQIERNDFSPKELTVAFEAFDPGWEALTPAERSRVLHLLLESVSFDVERNVVSLSYRSSGIKALAEHAATREGAAS
jgi:site-specific DNA recombinase